MTDSLGTWLRRERERQNISIATIAATTKIKASLFDGLERGDVSQWPAGIFRRSFIRAYAEAIGLDPDTVCRKFEEQFPEAGDTTRPAPVAVRSSAAFPAIMSATDEGSHLGFRLTLEETTGVFRGGGLLMRRNRRLKAIAWDAGSICAVAVSAFIVFDLFWMPLGLAALVYYLGGILVLGNSPGVCLFAPRPKGAGNIQPSQAREGTERAEPLSFEPAMHPLDVVSADQLIASPAPRLHSYPAAIHERVERTRARA